MAPGKGKEMRSRLSALRYIANNKRSAGVMILALALTLMTMYVIYVLLSSTSESFKPLMFEVPRKVSYVDLCGSSMGIDFSAYETDEELSEAIDIRRAEIAADLESHEGIDKVWYTQVLSGNYNAVAGNLNFEIPLLEEDQIPEYLDHMGVKVIEGRMPSGDGELLASRKVLQNMKIGVGDWFLDQWYGEAFKVVGVIDSDLPLCVGMPNGYTNSGWYFVVLNDENNTDLSKLLGEYGITTGVNDDIWDAQTYAEMYRNDVESVIEGASLAVISVAMIFLSISILVAYVSMMRNRVNEYCLYASIGYSKGEIYRMMMREMGLIFGIGAAAGVVLSLGLSAIIVKAMIEPMGLYANLISLKQFFRIGAAFAMIAGLLQIPMLVTSMKIKTIDALED